MTATATRKKPAAKKAAAKSEPTPAPTTRVAMLARLSELGYTGPTSYTATVLRETVLPWLEAGAPEGDESIPAGVMQAMHPHLRPVPKAKKKPAAYLRAVADLRAMLDNGADLDAVAAWAKQEGAA